MALIGYARVSTSEQDLALQLDALRKAGCERVFEERASGAKTDRPGLAEALTYVRAGDAIVVWKLDRLGRSMAHLIETVRALDAKGVASGPSPRAWTPPRPAAPWSSTCSERWPSSSAT